MLAESAGNPSARSPAGAMGLMQLMPGTAAELRCDDPFNPEKNIRAGVEYDAQCLAKVCTVLGVPFPEPVESAQSRDPYRFMLASYNGGFGYVLAAIKEARAPGLPLVDWATFAAVLPRVTVRGRHPDSKQIFGYVEKILPAVPA